MIRTAPLALRKKPRQQRSRETCDVILAAAGDVLERNGIDAFNTNAVAERAGVSVGSVYQYFPGKEAILAALIREMRREMLADIADAARPARHASLDAAVRELIGASLRHHVRNFTLTGELERVEDALPLDEETAALKRSMGQLVAQVLAHHEVVDPERAAFDLIALCHGLVHAALQAGESDLDDLARRLERAALGYLRR